MLPTLSSCKIDINQLSYDIMVNDQELITSLNTNIIVLLGIEAHQLLHKHFNQLITDKDQDRWKRIYANLLLLDIDDELKFKIRLQKHNGTSIEAQLVGMRTTNLDGKAMLSLAIISSEKDTILRQSSARLLALLDAIPDLMFEVGVNGKIYSFHSPNIELIVAPKAEIIGKYITKILPTEAARICMQALQEARIYGFSNGHQYKLELDKGTTWFELSIARKKSLKDEGLRFIMLARDITDRKKIESINHRLTQLYTVLSQCNQAIVRCDNQQELFENICSHIVAFGGMDMAWVGLVETSDQSIKPVAISGDKNHYLNSIHLSLDEKCAYGIGPASVAIHTNQSIIIEDCMNDKRTEAWKEQAVKSGWASSAAIPIHINDITIGVLCVYSKIINTFNEDIRKLLEEMAEDISYALKVFERDTLRKDAERALVDSEFRWKFAIEGTGDGVWDWNIETDTKTFSKQWKSILGYTESDQLPTGKQWEERFHPDDKSYVDACMQAYLDKITSNYNLEFRMKCKDGGYKWVMSRGMIVSFSENGKPLRMIGTISDISARKHTESELRIAAVSFEALDGLIVTDAKKIILRVNQALIKMSGYSASELVGKSPKMFSSGLHEESYYSEMDNSLMKNGVWEGEISNRHKNGSIYSAKMRVTAVRNSNDVITNYISTASDNTVSKIAADEIHNLAFFDMLTKLPNRRLFGEKLKQSLASSIRSGLDGAMLFLDLDNFKTLNDTLGHDFGDLLLQKVADRLKFSVRDSDTVARIGGDEFTIILEDLSANPVEAATQAEHIAKKILRKLSEPYHLNLHEYQCTASIGIALFNSGQQISGKASKESLLKQADIAMYQAKKEGRNTLRFFDPKMQSTIVLRAGLEKELGKAIDNHEFSLHFQVQVDQFNQATGAEALIRWIHPTRGLLTPVEFIDLTEETNLIIPIGLWVLETACQQLSDWKDDPLTSELTLSINVSAKQFHQNDFVIQVEIAIELYCINPMLLKFELTESILLSNVSETIIAMTALKNMGIQFSLDDFGTGYSSLQYLKQLPIYQLKIDQSFVRDISIDSSDQAIVCTIIAMANTLNLNVIAEGVETELQRQFLLSNGCNNYQGYLFGRPMPVAEFESSLRSM